MQSSFDFTSNFHGGDKYSTAAYQSIKDKKNILSTKVATFVHNRGLMGATSDEVEQALQIPHQTASARLTELRALQVVVDSGKQRKTRSGRAARVVVYKGLIA